MLKKNITCVPIFTFIAEGNLVLTLERTPRPVSAKTQQPNGKVWDVPKNYKSAMLSGWNKWCFTGGYMEMNVRFPGSPYVSTYWPAFWAMGNLGRMGYMKSTGGFWPYSYSECCMGCTMNTSQPGSKVPSQRLSACPDPPGFDRTAYGMKPGVGRNAPEFDVFEGSTAYGPGVSQTLQMAPLLPEGTTWDNLDWYVADFLKATSSSLNFNVSHPYHGIYAGIIKWVFQQVLIYQEALQFDKQNSMVGMVSMAALVTNSKIHILVYLD